MLAIVRIAGAHIRNAYICLKNKDQQHYNLMYFHLGGVLVKQHKNVSIFAKGLKSRGNRLNRKTMWTFFYRTLLFPYLECIKILK